MKSSPSDLLSALHTRYATKKFDPSRKLDAATWETLIESLVLAPSSFGLQPWRFFVVNQPETRARLREVSWGQPQITDADRLVVIATRTDLTSADIDVLIECLSIKQGKSMEELTAYRGVIEGFASALDASAKQNWNSRQCYIALGQLMTTAAAMGVDTCPLEGIDKSAYDQILEIEGTGYATVVACAIGYRADDDKYAEIPKARFARESVVRVIS